MQFTYSNYDYPSHSILFVTTLLRNEASVVIDDEISAVLLLRVDGWIYG